jgi:hypothetical protein
MGVTPRAYYKITTASVCAVVILLGTLATFAFAQETPAPTTTAETPTVAPYTIETLDEVPGTAPAGDFVVGPGKAELVVNPGESRTIELVVSNRTGETRFFNLEVEDAIGSYDIQNPVVLLGNDHSPYTLRDYISYPVPRFELAHNQRARVPVTVSIPANAEAGGKYGSVLVTTVSKNAELDPEEGASAASAIVSRLGTLFFITIPGDIQREGELQSFATLPEQKFFSDGPINFQLLFENKGNIHLSPYGELRIQNLFGEEVGFVEIDPWFALPKSLRSREISWNRELLIGRYTATVNINRGYDDIFDTKTITFWVLPWKIIVPIFVGLFLVFFVLRFFAKNFEFKRKGD